MSLSRFVLASTPSEPDPSQHERHDISAADIPTRPLAALPSTRTVQHSIQRRRRNLRLVTPLPLPTPAPTSPPARAVYAPSGHVDIGGIAARDALAAFRAASQTIHAVYRCAVWTEQGGDLLLLGLPGGTGDGTPLVVAAPAAAGVGAHLHLPEHLLHEAIMSGDALTLQLLTDVMLRLASDLFLAATDLRSTCLVALRTAGHPLGYSRMLFPMARAPHCPVCAAQTAQQHAVSPIWRGPQQRIQHLLHLANAEAQGARLLGVWSH